MLPDLLIAVRLLVREPLQSLGTIAVVQRHDDGRMSEQMLHHRGRQLAPAALLRPQRAIEWPSFRT
jgi:hypothetical protein